MNTELFRDEPASASRSTSQCVQRGGSCLGSVQSSVLALAWWRWRGAALYACMPQPYWCKHCPRSYLLLWGRKHVCGIWGNNLQVGVVEVTCNSNGCLPVHRRLFANGSTKKKHRTATSVTGVIYCSIYHVSIKLMMLQSIIFLWVMIHSHGSSILFARDRTLARKMPCRDSRWGGALSPPLFPPTFVLWRSCLQALPTSRCRSPLMSWQSLEWVGDWR